MAKQDWINLGESYMDFSGKLRLQHLLSVKTGLVITRVVPVKED